MRTCQPGSPARAEHAKPFHYVSMVVVLLSTSACQTSPVAPSGYLSTYAGVVPQSGRAAKKKGARKHRDDAASDAIQSVYIEPAVLALKVQTELSDKEKGMVLRELDRQICFEVSERFLIASAPSPEAGTIRTAVVQLRSTERIGSIAAAAVDYFNPLPLINFRVPGTTGGLGVETELVDSSGRQVAALLWNRRTGFLEVLTHRYPAPATRCRLRNRSVMLLAKRSPRRSGPRSRYGNLTRVNASDRAGTYRGWLRTGWWETLPVSTLRKLRAPAMSRTRQNAKTAKRAKSKSNPPLSRTE
jgi:hypothetical protein